MNDTLRQHRRCPVNVIARIRVNPDEDLEARCATDLSLGGLKMVLDHELEPGHRVKLEFRPLQSRGRIESVAAVRWCRPQGEHFAAGLEFVEMDEGSRERFEEALEVLEDRSRNGPVRCLSEAVIETQSVEAFASSYGTDLSEARLTVGTEEPFDPGDQLLVVVDTGDQEPAFRADSVVCSCERADGGYSVGVRFWYLDETSRRFVEQVDAALEPARGSGRWRGVDEEAWFEEGERLSGLHRLEIPRAVVSRWPLPQRLGIGVAGVSGLAAAALALFLVFRGPAVEGLPSTDQAGHALITQSGHSPQSAVVPSTLPSRIKDPSLEEPRQNEPSQKKSTVVQPEIKPEAVASVEIGP
ncbi:MAG: hypothetical protein GXP54_01625, partial [Deltaproteobacteria bacterium]|nr:hypothetical protein [Deltaproteobacteria bacterium]